MSTLEIKFNSFEQYNQLVDFLNKLKVDFKITESNDFSAEKLADSDVHDSYKASMKALADDWDDPENDHWDKY
jgi:ATP-dependent RNA circularization protein (DNA/RNA ligase family)